MQNEGLAAREAAWGLLRAAANLEGAAAALNTEDADAAASQAEAAPTVASSNDVEGLPVDEPVGDPAKPRQTPTPPTPPVLRRSSN